MHSAGVLERFGARNIRFSPRPLARAASRSAMDVLFPERCVGCGAFGTSFCEACEGALTLESSPARCPHCWARWPGPDNCPRCYAWDALDGAEAALDYEGNARKIVRALKYRHTRSLAAVMARQVAPLLAQQEDSLVVPIPLHRSRLLARGFNQAELLLRRLEWDQPAGRLLRNRKTRAQYGLSLGERRNNVRGAFTYEGPRIAGARVILIDDVVTTGSTANECARVLKDAGAVEVRVVAFARASYSPGLPAGESIAN